MKIVLVCSAGMSTSILVSKMQEAAKERNLEAEIDAFAEAELKNHMEGLDVVLIGPQVRFLERKLRDTLEPQGIKVAIIDQMAYGLMKGDQVLEQAIALHEA